MWTGNRADPLRNARVLGSRPVHIEWHLTVLNQVCLPSIWCGRDWERLSVSAPGDFYILALVCVCVCVCGQWQYLLCQRNWWAGGLSGIQHTLSLSRSLPPIHTHLSLLLYFCIYLSVSRAASLHFTFLFFFKFSFLFLFSNPSLFLKWKVFQLTFGPEQMRDGCGERRWSYEELLESELRGHDM